METKKTYSEKLRDPRWQKKRLEILSRDNFCCQSCMDSRDTLHVHHRYYINGNQPWEYPDNLLITLCKDCHKIEADVIKKIEPTIIKAMHDAGANSFDFKSLYSVIDGALKIGENKKMFAIIYYLSKKPELIAQILSVLYNEIDCIQDREGLLI